jgi:hypothetical protein
MEPYFAARESPKPHAATSAHPYSRMSRRTNSLSGGSVGASSFGAPLIQRVLHEYQTVG